MPNEYSVRESHVRIEAFGSITLPDTVAFIRALAGDPAVLGRRYILLNMNRGEPALPTGDLRHLVDVYRPLVEAGLRAIAIVAGFTHVFGMSRAFSIYGEALGIPIHVFRREDEALAWLDSLAAGEG